jgi:acetylornithine/succinyldiaminopimelate/putrescine aminotransferase
VTAVSTAVLKSLLEDGWIEHCRTIGKVFREKLAQLKDKHPAVQEVRGLGLILGLVLDRPGASVVKSCMEAGFLINCTQDCTLRFIPPLVVREEEIDALVKTLDRILRDFK